MAANAIQFFEGHAGHVALTLKHNNIRAVGAVFEAEVVLRAGIEIPEIVAVRPVLPSDMGSLFLVLSCMAEYEFATFKAWLDEYPTERARVLTFSDGSTGLVIVHGEMEDDSSAFLSLYFNGEIHTLEMMPNDDMPASYACDKLPVPVRI